MQKQKIEFQKPEDIAKHFLDIHKNSTDERKIEALAEIIRRERRATAYQCAIEAAELDGDPLVVSRVKVSMACQRVYDNLEKGGGYAGY